MRESYQAVGVKYINPFLLPGYLLKAWARSRAAGVSVLSSSLAVTSNFARGNLIQILVPRSGLPWSRGRSDCIDASG